MWWLLSDHSHEKFETSTEMAHEAIGRRPVLVAGVFAVESGDLESCLIEHSQVYGWGLFPT